MTRILGSNFSEWAVLRFGIQLFRTGVADHSHDRLLISDSLAVAQ